MPSYTLPCGYLDPSDEEYPSELLTDVGLIEMTGHEEDILGDKSKANTATNEVLSRCMTHLGPIKRKKERRDAFFVPYLDKMLMPDRTFLMIRLRQLSLGDDFAFEARCPVPDCKHLHRRMAINLGDLKVVTMEDPMKRQWEATLPSGKMVVFRALTGKDERKLSIVRKNKKDTFLTHLLMTRLVELDGVPIKQDFTPVQSLSVRDRDFLRGKFDEVEGGIDTQLELECEECGNTWEMVLPVGAPSFFFPSGINA